MNHGAKKSRTSAILRQRLEKMRFFDFLCDGVQTEHFDVVGGVGDEEKIANYSSILKFLRLNIFLFPASEHTP